MPALLMSDADPLPIFRRLWHIWVRFGHWLGDVMSWVWMPLFYFVIALPFALGVRIFSDPLGTRRRSAGSSHWHPKKLPPPDLAWARSQGSIVHSSSTTGDRRLAGEEAPR
ncbi:MAG: hypothetical protein IT578_09050 [Verrucomicrobiae bacterium]|nr:hypothetical protein [Verrucomicrobiae bacterium]